MQGSTPLFTEENPFLNMQLSFLEGTPKCLKVVRRPIIYFLKLKAFYYIKFKHKMQNMIELIII